ncbi:uncharacterized protein LOC120688648 [Panicum virgatum]|uniref:uncharacterized protein LOC120688648 n=1 Tax=Panicum virgatum TaxID=38727 RepID=UPI0019D564D0|nr:uncharacterized protein LOC120688648 [Panicum virgatum]
MARSPPPSPTASAKARVAAQPKPPPLPPKPRRIAAPPARLPALALPRRRKRLPLLLGSAMRLLLASLISVVLDVSSGNYTRWRDQFLLTVGKFSLQEHVLPADPVATYPDWARMDCVVKYWILGTISDNLADTISSRGSTAHDTWVAIESQFLGNRETRALYLDTQFRGFVQGDLSITDYCRRLKRMADDLGDLGETVTDRTLVLNLIRGLNEHYANIAHPKAPGSTPTALVASHASAPAPASAGGDSVGGGSGGSGGANPKAPKNRRSKRGSKKDTTGGNQGGQGSSGGKGGQSWPSFWNPWIGSIQMWPGSRPPLAPIPQPRPAQHQQQHPQYQQQALLAYQQALLSQQQQQPPTPSSVSTAFGQWAPPSPGFYNLLAGLPAWDQQSLASAISTTTLNLPQNTDWKLIVKCNSSEALYPLHLPATHSLVASTSPSLWHHRLGHPGHDALAKLASTLPACPSDGASTL